MNTNFGNNISNDVTRLTTRLMSSQIKKGMNRLEATEYTLKYIENLLVQICYIHLNVRQTVKGRLDLVDKILSRQEAIMVATEAAAHDEPKKTVVTAASAAVSAKESIKVFKQPPAPGSCILSGGTKKAG